MNALAVDRLVRGLAPPPLLVRAEDDRVVGAVRAGDVDLVDLGVPAEVGAHLGAAVDHPEEAALDQRRERLLDERTQVDVDRVRLEQHDLVLDEQLVERVHRADRGDVAGAEHQRDLPLADRRVIGHGLRLREDPGRGHPRLHPDVGGDPGVEGAVIEIEREDPRHHLAVRAGSHRAGDARPAVGLDVEQRLAQQPQVAQDEVGPDHRLFPRAGLAGSQPLGLGAERRPALRHGEEPAAEIAEDRLPFLERDLGPGSLALLERRHRGVHLGPRRGAGRAVDDLRGEGVGTAGGGGHEKPPSRSAASRHDVKIAWPGISPHSQMWMKYFLLK